MLRRSLLVPLLAIALTACGGSTTDPDQAAEAPTSPGLPAADDGAAGGSYMALPPMRAVDESAQDASPRSFQEALYDETDDSFHVIYETGVEPCYVLADVEVIEEDDQITVTLLEGHVPDENGEAPVCIEIAERVSTPVDLEQPFADRTLIDGATGEEVPVSVIKAGDAPTS